MWRPAAANARLLSMPVDILAPCALERQIHSQNADAVQAKIVVEGERADESQRGCDSGEEGRDCRAGCAGECWRGDVLLF